MTSIPAACRQLNNDLSNDHMGPTKTEQDERAPASWSDNLIP